jgi:hypothetical protein
MARAMATTIRRQWQMRILVENWKWIIGLGTKTRFRTTEGTPEQKRGLIHDLANCSALRVLNSYGRLRRLKVMILLVTSFGELIAFKSYFMQHEYAMS